MVMPRYFLRVRDGETLLPDDGEGVVFDSIEQVRSEAIQSAREILSSAVLSGKAGSLNTQIEVTDEAGTTILTMPIGRATGTDSQT
jgi:uncharacterized protein DUF6894